nr:MAG TPA: hypothetical protein [Caudoviricetes sp.]
MATNTYATDLEFIGDIIQTKLNEQPARRKYANTVTTAIGTAITVISQVLLLPLDLPDWVMWAALALTSLGTVLGVNKTKNGFSDSQIEKLRQWQSQYIDRQHNLAHVNQNTGITHAAPVGAPRHAAAELSSTMTAEDLGRMVDQFLGKKK